MRFGNVLLSILAKIGDQWCVCVYKYIYMQVCVRVLCMRE